MKQSAGLLLFTRDAGETRVLVVHPSGAYNRGAPWSLPKGEPDPDEPLEQAARRETREETGVEVDGLLLPLGSVDYTRSRKRVHAWAAPLPDGAAPRCASWEIDRAELVPMARAKELLQADQRAFIDRLAAILQRPAS